jgi:hypothetical protein
MSMQVIFAFTSKRNNMHCKISFRKKLHSVMKKFSGGEIPSQGIFHQSIDISIALSRFSKSVLKANPSFVSRYLPLLHRRFLHRRFLHRRFLHRRFLHRRYYLLGLRIVRLLVSLYHCRLFQRSLHNNQL